MKISKMRFKDYIWPCNPTKIQVSGQRSYTDLLLPGQNAVIQDGGLQKRIVEGSGSFTGANYLQSFAQLNLLFEQGGEGKLCLPGIPAFQAVFYSLNMASQNAPNLVHYSFTFWEVLSRNSPIFPQKRVHTVMPGETLWDISRAYGVPAEELLKKNPFIKNPNSLQPAAKIKIAF